MAGIYHRHSSFCWHCTHHRADSGIIDLVTNILDAFDCHQIFDYGLLSIPIQFSTIPQHGHGQFLKMRLATFDV